MIRNWGLKNKFVTVFLLLITLPTLIIGCIIYYQTTTIFKQQAENNAVGKLEKNEDNLTSIIRGIENMSSYMIYEKNFQTFFTATEEDLNQAAYKEAVAGINGYFTFQLMSHSYIDSILLIANDGHVLEIGSHVMGDEVRLNQVAKDLEGAPYWSNTYRVIENGAAKKNVVSLTRVINDINHINEPIGMVRIRLDQSKLFKTIENNTMNQTGDYFVMNKKGEVVLHQDPSLAGTPFPDLKITDWIMNSKSRTLKAEANQSDYLVVKKAIAGTDWVSIAIVNEGEVVKSLYNVRGLFVFMFFLLLVLGAIAFIGFYQSFIRRIVELTKQTKQLGEGDFTANVPVSSQDEIGKLGLRFNKMVTTIQKYINQEYKLKIKQRESELKALQSQIDPHFLYNTLDMIRWTARLEKAMETGQLIERLSKIFRMNLNMGKMWVKVEEEVQYIQNYLELQKSRVGNRLNYSIFYDDQIKDIYIIKQILQPLVENSILHGFDDLPRQGVIRIRLFKVEKEIWMDVIDNGWGFPNEKQEQDPNRKSGYAIPNLVDRLEFAFGEEATFEVLDSVVGTWIRLKLPISKDDNRNQISNETGE
jgi:two-component system, sensor histidine kinase YesM